MGQQGQIIIPRNLPLRTIETEQWYKDNYKYYWSIMELVPSEKEDTQLPFLIRTLKEQLDIDKIETVLEVGIGYGRVAKGILDNFPNINLYDGVDISELAIEESDIFLDDYVTKTKKGKRANTHTGYCHMVGDFETLHIPELYDLVISCATLSVLPTDKQAQTWLDKMISLSKKYVVNLDYHEDSDSNLVFNNARNYPELYGSFGISSLKTFTIPDYPNEKLYITRVK